jgi:hypothetical protein
MADDTDRSSVIVPRIQLDAAPFGLKVPSFMAKAQNRPSISNWQMAPTDQKPNPSVPGAAKGGSIDHAHKIAKEKSTPCHTGIITMAVGGRTDHIPMNVLEGSYVLPADIVSGLGEGNTLAGSKILDKMFGAKPNARNNYRPVPIVAAGGEYVIHPDEVLRIGKGNMNRGHEWLDHFVKGVRKHLIKTLSKLPGPKRD